MFTHIGEKIFNSICFNRHHQAKFLLQSYIPVTGLDLGLQGNYESAGVGKLWFSQCSIGANVAEHSF